MLLPDQVVPKLSHADRFVRDLAARYLGDAHDPGPATADDIWKAVEQAGGIWLSVYDNAMQKLPQTESSLRRTLAALEAKPDELLLRSLTSVIENLPYGLLMRFRDLIEASPALPDDLRQHLQKRYELAELAPGPLWEQLIAYADEMEKAEEWPDARISGRLLEALARNPEPAAWAIAELGESRDITLRDVFAVDLLGKMRYRPSAELLHKQLIRGDVEDSDGMLESATHALVRVGSPQVVQLVADSYATRKEPRYHALEILSRIKLPKSEAVMLQLLERESDREMKTLMAGGLCELATNEPRALEKLREMIAAEKWDRTVNALDEDVVALFLMVGHHTPELASWRADLDNEKKRQQSTRMAFKQKSPATSELVEMIRRRAESEAIGADEGELSSWEVDDDELASIAPAAAGTPPPPPAPATIRRATPKVGRNDPCPCGSGKKYKKCCGK